MACYPCERVDGFLVVLILIVVDSYERAGVYEEPQSWSLFVIDSLVNFFRGHPGPLQGFAFQPEGSSLFPS